MINYGLLHIITTLHSLNRLKPKRQNKQFFRKDKKIEVDSRSVYRSFVLKSFRLRTRGCEILYSPLPQKRIMNSIKKPKVVTNKSSVRNSSSNLKRVNIFLHNKKVVEFKEGALLRPSYSSPT